MPPTRLFHVIDSVSSSRAQIVTGLLSAGSHAEPYESMAEFASRMPDEGVVLFRDSANSHTILRQLMVERGCWLPALAYGQAPSPWHMGKLLMDGILGFLELPLDFAVIRDRVSAIRHENESRYRAMHQGVEAQMLIARLSPREREVLDALAEGCSSKLIARRLDISPRTVDIHRANLMAKLDARRAAEAIRIALLARIVPLSDRTPAALAA